MRRDPKKKLVYPPPDSYLRACKPTEGQAWVHVLCSVFIPEINYSDAERLRLVEGVSAIPQYRWQNVSLHEPRLGCAIILTMTTTAGVHAVRQRRRCGHPVQ